MTWIKHVSYAAATGRLRKLYDRVRGPDDNVDNIMLAHSLRPHTMEGHMALYKTVLHHTGNAIPKWFLEALGVYVSMLNRCDYCLEHHFAGMQRLLADQARAQQIRQAMHEGHPETALEPREGAAMQYAFALTREPSAVAKSHLESLRAAGWSDGEILEINQVVAYFAYANRTVLGLGVHTEGDVLGLSPNQSDQPDNWNHS